MLVAAGEKLPPELEKLKGMEFPFERAEANKDVKKKSKGK